MVACISRQIPEEVSQHVHRQHLRKKQSTVMSKEGDLLIPVMSLFCMTSQIIIHVIFHVKPVRRGLVNGSGYNNCVVPENIVAYLPHEG